jgi:ribonuclease I
MLRWCLGEYLNLKGRKLQENGDSCTMKSCIISTLNKILLGMMKSRRIWVKHTACMGQMSNAYKMLVESLKGRDHLKDLGTDERIILKWN